MTIPSEISHLIAKGALFAVNHSGGKDSQAMLIEVLRHVPLRQVVLVHADLGDVEWKGAKEHIAETAPWLPLIVAEPASDFFTMVERRGKFPSPSIRQCTSDLKRGPITRELRRHLADNPQFNGLLVSCLGMRAAESSSRAKLSPLTYSVANSKAGREWYDWLPIHDWSTERVFAEIEEAGQQPHPVYAKGMTRFSCCFCVMASAGDHRTAAKLAVEEPQLFNDPQLYTRLVETEERLGFTLSPSRKPLTEITGVSPLAQLDIAS